MNQNQAPAGNAAMPVEAWTWRLKPYSQRFESYEPKPGTYDAGTRFALVKRDDARAALAAQAAEIARLTAELEAAKAGTETVAEATPNEPGWICEHPRYGKWFISRAAVIEDWKRDQSEVYPDKPAREPDNEDIRIWFNENTSWIEVNFLGRQLAQPDVKPFKKSWLEEMKRNMNYLESAIEVKAPT